MDLGAKSSPRSCKGTEVESTSSRSLRQKLAAGGPSRPITGGGRRRKWMEIQSRSSSELQQSSEESPSAVAPTDSDGGNSDGSRKAQSGNSVKAIKDGTTGDYHKQLIQRAAGTAELGRREAEEYKRRGRDRGVHRNGSPSKKDKDKLRRIEAARRRRRIAKTTRRRKGKRERKRRGRKRRSQEGDPFRWEDSESCYVRLQGAVSEESPSTDEDAELEAPLRRTILQKHPGSVLNLLLEHIANQLQQSAEVDTPATARGRSHDRSQGGVILGPSHSTTLWSSPEGAPGDAQSGHLHRPLETRDNWQGWETCWQGRLIAIHQSLLDASWAVSKAFRGHANARGHSVVRWRPPGSAGSTEATGEPCPRPKSGLATTKRKGKRQEGIRSGATTKTNKKERGGNPKAKGSHIEEGEVQEGQREGGRREARGEVNEESL